MKIAVYGCGSIGARHIANLHTLGCEPIGIDGDEKRRAAVAESGFTVQAPDEPLPGDVKAAVIASPAPTHVALASVLLAKGLDVFIEKPLAPTAHETEPLRRLSVAAVVQVGYNLRFDASLRAFRAHLHGGAVGKPLFARIEFGQDIRTWRPGRDYRDTPAARRANGGGILLEASHELDLIHWLFPHAQTLITSLLRKVSPLDLDVEDLVVATLELNTGVVIELHLDMLRPTYRRRVEVVGTLGEIAWELDRSRVWSTYHDEMAHFIECIRERRAPDVGLFEGYAAALLADAIRKMSAPQQAFTATPAVTGTSA